VEAAGIAVSRNEGVCLLLIDKLQRLVDELEADLAPDGPSLLLKLGRIRERLEALDRLEVYFPEIAPDQLETDPVAANVHRRAEKIRECLEAANLEFYATIRAEIRRGAGADALLRWAHPGGEIEEAGVSPIGMGFDFLDELISGVLQLEEPDDGQLRREAEMVFYQPTPARHIFNLMRLTALTADDVLVDIGSGLGHVPLVISIYTEARAIGIELEGAYVDRARQCAERLGLKRVAFLQEDARAADFSSGTVFYFYTPFTGAMLRAVLDRLKCEAASRQIRVCTYGPCTPVIAGESWLEATATPETDRVVLFSSRD
jgi:hypothetical protein